MSPHDMDRYREAFDRACATLGWKRETQTREHERDSCPSWKVEVWLAADGSGLFEEGDLTRGLVREIIRIAAEREAAVASEREACAKVAEAATLTHDRVAQVVVCNEIAAAIRGRGKADA